MAALGVLIRGDYHFLSTLVLGFRFCFNRGWSRSLGHHISMGHGYKLLYAIDRGGIGFLVGQWHAQESRDESCMAGC